MECNQKSCNENTENSIDVTITGDPKPQASSTHEKNKNSTFRNWESYNRPSYEDNRMRRSILTSRESDIKHITADSSLGILDNISSLLGDSGVTEGRQSSNISNKLDTERELARKLLQRCSEPRGSSGFLEQDKENDANSQNLSTDFTPSTLTDSGQQSLFNRSKTLQEDDPQVIFKPAEISARSSALNASFNKSCASSSSPARRAGISFDTTAAAELMAQFGDEEFQSGSRVGSRLLADEIAWNQNNSYAMPMNVSATGDKERLELSCFSGIIGDFDLSVESYAGRRVSVGEFFQRKCGNFGQLQENDSAPRPSFGLPFKNSNAGRNIGPLINETKMSEEPSVREEHPKAIGSADDTKQYSLMSLSSIAQVLNDIDSPRRLVDEIILAKRNKKPGPSKLGNTDSNSSVYPGESSFNSTSLSVNEKPERDIEMKGGKECLLDSPRFSLDSKIALDNLRTKSKSKWKSTKPSSNIASSTPAVTNASNSYIAEYLQGCLDEKERREIDGEESSPISFNELKKMKKSSIYHSNITRSLLSSLDDSVVAKDPKLDFKNSDNRTEADIPEKNSFHAKQENKTNCNVSEVEEENRSKYSKTFVKKTDLIPTLQSSSSSGYLKDIKYEKVSPGPSNQSFKESLNVNSLTSNSKTNTTKIVTNKFEDNPKPEFNVSEEAVREEKKFKSHGNHVSARNTTELFSCIVGVTREAEIELSNKSDRWMTCTLTLHQIQENRENISLSLPEDTILVEPDRGKLVKIGVNVRKMGKPIIAVINIAASDMVTRSSGLIKHVMCFVPEEPQIGVLLHSGKDEIDFQTVAERCSKTFPVTLENKNNAEIPIRIMILKHPDIPQIFSIDSLADETTNTINTYNLKLKPHQQFTVNVQFHGIPLSALNTRKSLYHATGKLIIQLRTDDMQGQLLKEITLNGAIGVCKIDLVDTPLPIIIPKKETRQITLTNSGDLAVLLSTSFVETDKSTITIDDFTSQPNSSFLQPGEKAVISLSYKSRSSESLERQVFLRVAAGGNEYYYPAIGDCGSSNTSDQATGSSLQRCATPQSRQTISPSSPHSSASNRSGNSGRHSPASAASTSTVSGDVIPIKSTHSALVWSSVKTGKTDIKEFTILNNSENKIKLQVNIVDKNKSFKFLKDRNAVSSMLLVLPRMGSKEISVIFSPSNPGAYAGKIVFTHYNNAKDQEESSQKRTIFLFGYGGFSKIEISQAFKDTGGTMWLSLGQMEAGRTLRAKIKLQNTGDLCSYAMVKLTPKALYPAMISSWEVNPTELLLGPGEIQWVTLEFHPRREDLALLCRADVSHVGTISITHGDEPTRWRIRRLYNKLKESGNLRRTENDAFRNIVSPLCRAFPGEALIQDLSIIKDSVQHLGDLCRGVSQYHVMLTMEINADETLTMLNDNADDTQMFYSVCSDSSTTFTSACDSYMPSETITDTNERGLSEKDFTVTPAVVTLAPPFRTEATITVSSLCTVAQPFETVLSHKEGLSVVPTEGMIPAGRSFPLKIQCGRETNKNVTAVLQIFMENHKREVTITVSASKN